MMIRTQSGRIGLKASLVLLGLTGLFAVGLFILFSRVRAPDGDLVLIALTPGQQLWHTGMVAPDYPYPLWTPILMLPLALLPTTVATVLWLWINVVLLTGSISLAITIFRWRPHPRVLGIAALAALTWLPVITALWLGQLIFVSLALLLGAVWAMQHRRWALVGLLLGLTLIKPHTTILVTGALLLRMLWERQWRGLAAFGLVVAALIAVCLPFSSDIRLILGQNAIGDHLDEYMVVSSTIWGLLLSLLPGAWWLPLGVSAGLLGWLAWRGWQALHGGTDADWMWLLAAATIINLMVLPYSWMHNSALMLFPLAYGATLIWERGRQRGWWFSAILGIYILSYVLFSNASQPLRQSLQIIPVMLVGLLLVALRATRRTPAPAPPLMRPV